jgi:hypothetical protein
MMIKVGDIIKSLDFPHTTEHYMIGRVIKVTEGAYYCDTIKQVSAGKEDELCEINSKFSTAKMGEHWMEDMFTAPRITVLG